MKHLLTADWTDLVVANFETEKKFLEQFLPYKTELNEWSDKYLMSLVGFMFSKPALFGISSPIYRKFEEINLRFYVRYKEQQQWKKGVVFIKEIAPSPVIGFMASWLYHENFISLPMKHKISISDNKKNIKYSWRIKKNWNYLKLQTSLYPSAVPVNSLESFIANHYWGYTKKSDNKTLQFEIKHQPWNIYPAISFEMNLDAEKIYGEKFSDCFSQKPLSVFLMDGSRTKVSSTALL